MERTFIRDLRNKVDQTVKLQGWLQTLRDQKKIQFLILRDPTGYSYRWHIGSLTTRSWLPGSAPWAWKPPLRSPVRSLTTRWSSSTSWKYSLNRWSSKIHPRARCHSTHSLKPLPALDYRLDWRYMDLRRPYNSLLFQVETTLEMAMREYWIKHGFIEVHSPKLTGSPSESGAELFSLDYFDRKAYLAQSPQFYKQMAMAAGFERIFEIGPVFRADPSFTARHMTEFTGVDMEISWIDSHEDVMAFEENWLQYCYSRVKELHGDAIKETFDVDLVIPPVPFPRIPMREAVEILKSRGYVMPADKKGDIDPAGEREIAAYVKEKYNHDFVFLTDWPVTVRPFYHMRLEGRRYSHAQL